MEKHITKIKVKKGEYTLSWEEYNERTTEWDKHTLVCKDPPREEFKERLQVMANHVTEICEFEQGATKKIVVNGITISYSNDNNYLVIMALKELNNSKSPMVINTPARPATPNGACTKEYCMSNELSRDLSALEEEAWRYIEGDRAQASLFADKTPTKVSFQGKPPAKDEQHLDAFEQFQSDKQKLLAHKAELLRREGYIA